MTTGAVHIKSRRPAAGVWKRRSAAWGTLSRQVVAGSGELELRHASAGISSVLPAVVTVAIAEAALYALLVLFSYILNLRLVLELGSARLVFEPAITEYEVIKQGVPVIVGGPPTIELY